MSAKVALPPGHCAGSSLVRLGSPSGVDPKGGGSSATVAEPAGYCPDVDATADQLGCGVVPQVLQSGVDSEPRSHPLVALRRRIRVQWEPAGKFRGEHERLGAECFAERRASALSPLVMLSEYNDGLRVEHDTSLLMRLGVLLVQLAIVADVHRAPDGQHRLIKVDVRPAKAADLAAAHPSGHLDPDERPPVGVQRPGPPDKLSSLFGSRRLWVGMRHRWLVCPLRNV